MYEIELKARVENREAVIGALNSFAAYNGAVQKNDTYYKLLANGKKVSARIRTETAFDGHNQGADGRVLLTYKRKERRTTSDGATIEVNDEKECSLSSADALESLLLDAGFVVSLTKTKCVQSWNYDGALFELCAVSPLGDFLEIEILSPTNEPSVVARQQEKLKSLLAKTGISADKIENRYYSELLRAAQKEHSCLTE